MAILWLRCGVERVEEVEFFHDLNLLTRLEDRTVPALVSAVLDNGTRRQ
jgi:hypothetical protein